MLYLICLPSDSNRPQFPFESHPNSSHQETWREAKSSSESGSSSTKPPKKTTHKLARTGSDGKTKKRRSHRPPGPAGSMLVSIDRTQLPGQQSLMTDSSVRVTKKRSGEKKVGRKAVGQGERRMEEESMLVRLERKKLTGPLGSKVKHIPPPLPPLTHSDSFTMIAAPVPADPITCELNHSRPLLIVTVLMFFQWNNANRSKRKRSVVIPMEVCSTHSESIESIQTVHGPSPHM